LNIKEFENQWNNVYNIKDNEHIIVIVRSEIRIYCDNYSIERADTLGFYMNHKIIAIVPLNDVITVL